MLGETPAPSLLKLASTDIFETNTRFVNREPFNRATDRPSPIE